MILNKTEAFQRLKMHEGLELFPYKCTAKKLTIGIGRNLEERGISEDEAFYLFNHDLANAEKEVLAYFPDAMTVLNNDRFYCLVDMCFNMGITRLTQFKNMWAELKKDIPDFHKVSQHMLDSKWAGQVGDRAKRLAYCMKYGMWEVKDFDV